MNIILQHWTGELQELHRLSSESIQRYALSLGADYRLLRGNVFRDDLTAQTQKLYMLDEEFDSYDKVVMVDMDCFARKGCEDSVFDEVGVGRKHVNHGRVIRAFPMLASPNHPFWGGAVYKTTKELRERLRSNIREEDLQAMGTGFSCHDEALMHRLAVLAKLPVEGNYMPDDKWCYSSFLPDPETAGIIHIRTKITPQGPKRSKMENLKSLKERGFIQ
jgi:hypothetical protein